MRFRYHLWIGRDNRFIKSARVEELVLAVAFSCIHLILMHSDTHLKSRFNQFVPTRCTRAESARLRFRSVIQFANIFRDSKKSVYCEVQLLDNALNRIKANRNNNQI